MTIFWLISNFRKKDSMWYFRNWTFWQIFDNDNFVCLESATKSIGSLFWNLTPDLVLCKFLCFVRERSSCACNVSWSSKLHNSFFIYMDMCIHAINCVWIHFMPTSLYPTREEKPFGLRWSQTQVLLLHKQPLLPLDHGSSGTTLIFEFDWLGKLFLVFSFKKSCCGIAIENTSHYFDVWVQIQWGNELFLSLFFQ